MEVIDKLMTIFSFAVVGFACYGYGLNHGRGQILKRVSHLIYNAYDEGNLRPNACEITGWLDCLAYLRDRVFSSGRVNDE